MKRLLLLLSIVSISSGYKILFLVPFPGTSHWLVLQNFAKELMHRGHEVTAIVNSPISKFNSPNYTEILINPPYDSSMILSQQEAIDSSDETDFEKIRSYERFTGKCSEHGLTTPNVQKIIHSEDLHFDLAIDGNFFHESWLMFAYKFNAPVVSICPYGYSDFFDRAMGSLTPWSHVPHMLLSYGDDMTYFQRVYNVILLAYDWWYRNWIMLPQQNDIAHRQFAHLAKPGKPLPNVSDLYRNISLFLVNVHKSISKPRPQMPGILRNGAHIKAPKQLSPHLLDYIESSEHGVIFFSLGSHLQSSSLPKEKIEVFINVFKGLKQRVIWKFENESYRVPPNVLIQKWLPQSDILAHSNVVLFITHGGISGTFEGSARGVPMLFIPFFADQRTNSLKAVQNGNGLMLPFSKLTPETFSESLGEILTNKQYNVRAKEVARLFNDNLVHQAYIQALIFHYLFLSSFILDF